MASIQIHGGDFAVGQRGKFKSGLLVLPVKGTQAREEIPLRKVMRVEVVNKEEKHRTGTAVGRGAIAAMIAGPIGSVFAVLGGPAGTAVALASGIVGYSTTNHTSNVTFEATFEGGRRLLATTDTATYTKLLAAAFDYAAPSASSDNFSDEPNQRGVPTGNGWAILGTLGAVFVVAGMINGVPLAWGIGIGALVLIIGRIGTSVWDKCASTRDILKHTRMMLARTLGHLTPVEIAARICGLVIFAPILILGLAEAFHSVTAGKSAHEQAQDGKTVRQLACERALADYQRRKTGDYECHETTFVDELVQFRVSVIAKGIYGFWVAFDRNFSRMPKPEADIFVDPATERVVSVKRLCSVVGNVHRPCAPQ
jgi:hypothetical protein